VGGMVGNGRLFKLLAGRFAWILGVFVWQSHLGGFGLQETSVVYRIADLFETFQNA